MIHLEFREGDNLSKLENAIKPEMDKHIQHLQHELKKLRTGRAHTSLIEEVPIACYDGTMKLRDLASLSTSDAQTLVIQPWDKNIVPNIEKAILQSDLGLTPSTDGGIIRLKIPPMTAARREELSKTVGKRLEECKVGIRNVRKEFNNYIRDLEKNKYTSEDTAKRLQEVLQKTTDLFIGKADELAKKRENDIRSV